MNGLSLANLCRGTARAISVLLIPMIAFYAFFVGMQIPGGGGNVAGFVLYLLFALAIAAGLLIAWRKEYEGALISLLAIAGFVAMGLLLEGFRGMLGEASPLAGPLHLLFAITVPGYHLDMSPLAKWVPLLSWVLVGLPALLFLVSWRLRKDLPEPVKAPSPKPVEESTEVDEKVQAEMIPLLRQGMDNDGIAERLSITKVHSSLLTAALARQHGVSSREELIEKLKEKMPA
jgi:hypothetical protein